MSIQACQIRRPYEGQTKDVDELSPPGVRGSGEKHAPEEKMFRVMREYHEELANAGVFLDASGLQPSSKGWRIRYSGNKRTVIDGPFTESKGLIAGYTMIRVKSPEEALEWAKRFPNPVGEGADAEIEVRRFFELQDFEPSEEIERFRQCAKEIANSQRRSRVLC